MEGSTEGSKECIFIFVFSYPHSTHSTPVQNIAPRNPPASPPVLRFLNRIAFCGQEEWLVK